MKYSFIEYLFVYLRCEVINMVVVVLKAATSFAGIDYNERKNEEDRRIRTYELPYTDSTLMTAEPEVIYGRNKQQ